MKNTPITVAHGDGIGPEIMAATLLMLREAGAALEIETIEVGQKVYERGVSSGIDKSAWDALLRTKVFLKAPITTPQGGGVKSLNVTIRKTLGLYANVRPCVAYHPYVATQHPKMNLVIVRENEEDVYAGIEYRQTRDVFECLKIMTRPGSDRLIRYGFEYAVRNGKKKVTCLTKDNIMKMTDGMFHSVFNQVAKEYPGIETDHWIIDIGAAKVASAPEIFEVIVVPNLYGDIISDIAAEVVGSVGLAGSANIGAECSMFEAIHGSAPAIAGQGIANPSGLLHGAIMMLVHIGQNQVAERLHNAWLKTLEDGIHPADIFGSAYSKTKVGTQDFAKAVIARLGQLPSELAAVKYPEQDSKPIRVGRLSLAPESEKALVGIDVFIGGVIEPSALAKKLEPLAHGGLRLQMISNRGLKVWPDGLGSALVVDKSRCRFMSEKPIVYRDALELLGRCSEAGLEVVKTENLYLFDGQPGFSLSQGQ